MPRLVLCLLALACSTPEPSPGFRLAVQVPGGVGLLENDRAGPPVPGSAGVQTFCWDREGRGFFVTTGPELAWLPVEGGDPEVIAGGFRAVRFPDVSTEGVIAFSATRSDSGAEGWEIWTVNADGSGLRRVAPGYDPSWSPNGRELYFENFDPTATIYVYDFAGDRVRQALEGEQRAFTVECSPGGRYLVFSSARGLMLYTIADHTERLLTDGSAYDRFASFSPDERFVAFYRQTSGGDQRHWLVRREIATGREWSVPVDRDVTPAYAPWRE